MKKYIKKIIVGIFALGALFLAQGVFASTWNGVSNDCPSINVANATTKEGWSNPCWTGTNIPANPGDTVSVRIYYHNTGTRIANNTKVFLSAGTATSTNHRFTGSITSSEGNLSFGPVYITTNPEQSLIFDSVKWYTENTSQTLTSLLNGQDGSEILSGGLSIGSIAPGWATQGSLVVSFKVSNNVVEPKTCSITDFTATPPTINKGEFSKLSWTTTNCNSVNIEGLGTVAYSGSKIVYPSSTTIYTLNAIGSSNQDSSSAKVNVSHVVNEMSGDINTSPSSCIISSGNSSCSVNLSWTTTNPENTSSVTSNGSTIANGNNGNKIISLSNGSKTYYLYNNGKLLDQTSASASCVSGSYWNGNYCTPDIVVDNNECTITSFSANPSSIKKGDSSLLSWTTVNCANISISGIGSYGLSKNGSQIIWPTSTKSYTLSAAGANGTIDSRTISVYVDDQIDNKNNCRIDSFSASNISIEEGDYTKLRWDTTNCERVNISNIGNVSEDGSKTVYPDGDITYTLTAYNPNGSYVKDSVRIYVDGGNSDSTSSDSCKINSFRTSDSYIEQGELAKLTWRTTNCKNLTISNIGRVPESGSEIVYPSATTTYILRAYGNKNNDTETLKINVGQDYIYEYNTSVVTTVATNVTQSSASLNGLLTNTSSSSQNVYFDYGTTVNMGNRTNAKTVSGSVNFTEYVSGLAPNTIYFFQAVASGNNGISRGAIEVFRTPGYSVVGAGGSSGSTTTRVTQGTTVVGSASPVMLEIENKYATLNKGDVVEYSVYYKNISKSTLRNPMVQVYIPEGITVTNNSAGTYSMDDRILSVPIEDLSPQEEGIIYFLARVNSIDSTRAQIVTTAILVYTNTNGAQENAMAYVLNDPGSTSSSLLGASAFQGGFLGLSLVGWLFIILLILLIVLIARTYYNKEPKNQ